MAIETRTHLKPVVYFREYPFGVASDPGMREFASATPQADESSILDYSRRGHVPGRPMGADLPDWFDRSRLALAGRPDPFRRDVPRPLARGVRGTRQGAEMGG